MPVRTIASLIEMGETHEVLREDYPHVPQEAYPVAVLWAHANPRRRPSRTPLGHGCEPARAQASRRTGRVKFWIDECLTPMLVGHAHSHGYEATSTRATEGNSGCETMSCWHLAVSEEFVFVTNNLTPTS